MALPDVPAAEGPTQAAEHIIGEYLLTEEGLYEVPIDPVKLAAHLNIKVEEAPLDDNVAGLIVKQNSQAQVRILLNSKDADVRKRFTCAHELGHFVKRQGAGNGAGLIGFVDYRNEMSGTGADPEEIWANKFSAALLMPRSAVQSLWASGKSVNQMARTFGVSRQAMEIRVSNLGLV